VDILKWFNKEEKSNFFPCINIMSESILEDCELIEENLDDKSDFIQTSGNLLSSINYKLFIFMYLIGILVFSDIFIENFLTQFSGAVDGENSTTKGTMIQLLVYCILMIVVDLLIKGDWV
jgi:hypothetical protein